AQLDLDGIDLRDAPRLLDLSHVHVAQADRVDQSVAFQGCERANARRQWCPRIGRMELIERDAIEAERLAACFARGNEVPRGAGGDAVALRAPQPTLRRHDDP